jgi:hypothetical protein
MIEEMDLPKKTRNTITRGRESSGESRERNERKLEVEEAQGIPISKN